MRGVTSIVVGAGLCWTSAAGIQLHKRTYGSPRVVSVPIQRRDVADPAARDRLRRRATQQVTLDNLETLYFANGTIGTPPQRQRLHIDTGSSDLWVNTPSSQLCSDSTAPCRFAGSYAANDSSTYQYIASDFNISYVDGSGAVGDYVSDTFSMGGTTLDRLQFGIGYSSSSYEGILGLGYTINEVQVGRAGKAAYQNLPAKMVDEKLISSNAYSIWLNDLDSSTGSILFGGVDTAKFEGTLQTLPIQKTRGLFAEFLITLTKLQLGDTVIANNQAQAVLLDTGSSLTYLPTAMAQAIYEIVDAQYDSSASAAYVPCSLAQNSSKLVFTFSGATISVDMTELVIDVGTTNGRRLRFSDGTLACIFGIAPVGQHTAVLGDTFLRSAYVVYDLANNEISLAQTTFNATATDIQEIGTGTNSVPDTTDVPNPVAASDAATGGARLGGTATATASGNAAMRTSAPLFGAMAAMGASVIYVGL